MKYFKDIIEAHPNSKIYDKCWDGHRKVPGKKRGEKGSCEKIGEQDVAEGGYYNPMDQERREQDAMDYGRRAFKRAELQHELGHEDDPNFERNFRQQQMDRDRGPWYIKINGKILKVKGEVKVFDWKRGANNYALAVLKNKPELKDKIFLTKKNQDDVKEFAPAGSGTPPRGPKTPGKDPWDGNDGSGDDPYSRPEPEYYSRSIDFFGKFEADHFDKEDFNKKTGVFKGYWENNDGSFVQIAYFKFDNAQQAAQDFNDSPGMGWYYEPVDEGVAEGSEEHDIVNSRLPIKHIERKLQEAGLEKDIRIFLQWAIDNGCAYIEDAIELGEKAKLNDPQLTIGLHRLKKLSAQGVAEGSLEEVDRRGFLKGLGDLAAYAGVIGAAGYGLHSYDGKAGPSPESKIGITIHNLRGYNSNFANHDTAFVTADLYIQNFNPFPVKNIKIKFIGVDKNYEEVDSTKREYKPTLKSNEKVLLKGFDIGMFARGTKDIRSIVTDCSALKESVEQGVAEGIEARLNTKYSLKNMFGDVKSLDNLSLDQLNKAMDGHVTLVGRKFRSQEGNSFRYDVKLANGEWYIMHVVYVHGLIDAWLTDEENNKIPLSKFKAEGSVTKKPQPYNNPDWAKKLSKDQLDALAGTKYKNDKKITKETQAVTDNSLGYKNTLAVMKAADSSQEATINLGGEPVTLDYPEARFIAGKYKAFLRAGRQEEFFGYMSNPRQFDSMMKQLRDLIDKQKNFKGSVPGERGVEEAQAKESTDYEKSIPAGADEGRVKWKCPSCGVASGIAAFRTNNYKCPSCEEPLPVKGQMGLKHQESVSEDVDSPVAGAITRRIMSQRLDLLKQYGPELVGAAIDNVADYVGDVEEIGSSDVSAWVTQVERMLKENPPKAFAESLRLVGKHGEGAKTAKVYKDHEWGEYRVKFYTDGKHEGESADYHTDDRDDANDTAKNWTTKGEKVAESTYWCRQEKTRKLIPEGYKKTAKGYITKL